TTASIRRHRSSSSLQTAYDGVAPTPARCNDGSILGTSISGDLPDFLAPFPDRGGQLSTPPGRLGERRWRVVAGWGPDDLDVGVNPRLTASTPGGLERDDRGQPERDEVGGRPAEPHRHPSNSPRTEGGHPEVDSTGPHARERVSEPPRARS